MGLGRIEAPQFAIGDYGPRSIPVFKDGNHPGTGIVIGVLSIAGFVLPVQITVPRISQTHRNRLVTPLGDVQSIVGGIPSDTVKILKA